MNTAPWGSVSQREAHDPQPPGAWQRCVGEPPFRGAAKVRVGVDVGGERSASAVVWLNEELHVGCAIFHGGAGVLDCLDRVRELAGEFSVQECVYDPWRFGQAAQELEREGPTICCPSPAADRMRSRT